MKRVNLRRIRDTKTQNLKEYYYSKHDLSHEYKLERKFRCKKGRYNFQEIIYWFFKILAMPITGSIFIIFFILIGAFRYPFLSSSVRFIFLFSCVLIFSHLRERLRAYKYQNKNNVIKHNCFTLNRIKEVSIEIGFVGDIMRMKNFLRSYDLRFNPSVKCFFKEVDVIVGNLEGVISLKRGTLLKQSLQTKIISELEDLLISPSSKWLLCLSNNHSADFGLVNFNHSLFSIIQNPNFYVFGRKDIPKVLLTNKINIACASEWSNYDNFEYISKYSNKKLKEYHCFCKFNILFPHWGYENERYVRTRIQKDALALLTGEKQHYSWYQRFIRKRLKKKIRALKYRKWDLIFGHHPHVRQPIMKFFDNKENVYKLVVFSGGNFTSGALILRRKKHTRGIIMKCKIGPLASCPSKMAIGQVKWRKTRIKNKIGKYKKRTVYIDRKEEQMYNIYALAFIIIAWLLFIITILIEWI